MEPKEHKDYSTAILDKKKKPNRLMVEDSINDDNSAIQMSEAKMKELNIFKGDPIFIIGKKRKQTVCIALIDSQLDDDKIRMNKVVRKNIKVRLAGKLLLNKIFYNKYYILNFRSCHCAPCL